MPRQSRIDTPGALQHIIIRGIERKAIFKDDADRENFVDRLGKLLLDTQTTCYAWALLTNHTHLLLRTGATPVSAVMRRLLTGHAIYFNHRHRRHGHLFQNRYKSILCEESAYLKQLVAYIHLNPFRAGIAENLAALQTYPFTGHCVLMGHKTVQWQDSDYVLGIFGSTFTKARQQYAAYVSKCALHGKRSELTGGGLVRSTGGWRKVRQAYREGIRLTSDERILGSSEFVEHTLSKAGEDYERRIKLKTAGIDLDAVIDAVCAHLDVTPEDLSGTSRRLPISHARSLVSYLAVRELRISGAAVARRMNQDRSSVSRAIARVSQEPQLMERVSSVLSVLMPGGKSKDMQQ